MPGVTVDGFEIKTLENILKDIRARQRAAPEIGPSVDMSDTSSLGQLNGTIANEIAELWELGAAVYASNDPEAAVGAAHDNIASLTGTPRRGAEPTRVGVTLNLDAGVTVPAGSLCAVEDRDDLTFGLETAVVNGGGVADDFPGVAISTADGPIPVTAGTLNQIVTQISGWNSVTNAEDGETGRNADTETTLRERRSAQLALRGGSTVRAMRADILELEEVEECTVLENTTNTISADGLPPKSFEVLLDDGDPSAADNDEIAQVIFDTKPGGIEPYGVTDSGTATDPDTGETFVMPFTRVVRLDVWVELTIQTGVGFPPDGAAQVAAKIGTLSLRTAQDVVALFVRSQAFGVAGVVDVPAFAIGFTSSPTLDDNLPVSARERAAFDTSRVTVVVA